jgi:hypothetical protein
MAPVASQLSSKVVVSPKGKTRARLMELYGTAAGVAAYYGYKDGHDATAIHTRYRVQLIDLTKVSGTELRGAVVVHYCHKTNTVAKLVHGLSDYLD